MRIQPWPEVKELKLKPKRSWLWGFFFGLMLGHVVTIYFLVIK